MKLLHVLILFVVARVNSKAEKPKSRIINGKNADVDQFPEVALLNVTVTAGNQYTCGGALIGTKWVLTAAQCVQDAQTADVYLGATFVEEAKVAYTVSANNIHIYPYWSALSNKNDIALVEIPYTAMCSDLIPAVLPRIRDKIIGKIGKATGWGLTDQNGFPYVHRLQWTNVIIISNELCSAQYDEVTPDKLCALMPNGVSASLGDGGSPLLLGNIVVGIASVCSPSTCLSGDPVVFTRVTKFMPWIRSVTQIIS